MADPTVSISSAVSNQNAADLPGLFNLDGNTDVAISFLRTVFGPVIDYIIGTGGASLSSGDHVIATAMGLFNSGLMFLGVIYIGWTGLSGAIHIAETGKFGGNSGWSPVWVPIRTMIGVGSLAPVFSGYSFLQIFILWVSIQGIALANNIYTSVIDLVSKQGVIGQTYASPDTRALALNVLRGEVCTAAFNQIQKESGSPTRFKLITKETRQTDVSGSFFSVFENLFRDDDVTNTHVEKVNGRYTWGDPSGGEYSFKACGGVEINMESKELTHANVQFIINQAHADGLARMVATMRAAAKNFVSRSADDYQNVLPSFEAGLIERAALDYSDGIKAAAVTAVKGQEEFMYEDFKEKATQGGFLVAGSWYFNVARMNGEISSVIGNAPVSVSSNINQDLNIFTNEAMKPFLARVNSLEEIINNREYVEEYGHRVNRLKDGGDANSGASLGDKMVKAIVSPLGSGIDLIKDYFSLGSNVDSYKFVFDENEKAPLVQAKELGDIIVNSGVTALGAIGASVAISGAGAGNVIGKGAGTDMSFLGLMIMLSPFIFMFMMAIFIFGLMLSVYLPLVPFIIWIGACISFFLMIIGAVISAPMWAIAFLEPQGGEGPAGKAAQGWYMVIGLFTRPTLMIFGLLAAMYISQMFVAFISDYFFLTMQTVSSGSISGLLIFIATLIIYVSVITTTMHLVYSLITMIPDQILRWIGAGVEQLGEMGTETQTRGAVVAGFGAVQRGVAGAAPGGGSGGGGNDDDKKPGGDEQHQGADAQSKDY